MDFINHGCADLVLAGQSKGRAGCRVAFGHCQHAGGNIGRLFPAADAFPYGAPLQGRSIAVRRSVRSDEIRNCAIVFVTDVDEHRQAEALRTLRGLPVLTIGDAEGFADAGGVIGLVAADERIQFEVNLEAAQHASLKINSQLLKLARAVKGRTP